MSFSQDSFVQDACDQDARCSAPKKHDVAALFVSTQMGLNVIAGAPRCNVVGKFPATRRDRRKFATG